MENYSKVLKKRITIMSMLMVVMGCIIVFDQFFASDSLKKNNIYEFQIGMLVGLVLVGAVRIIKLNNVLKDEKKIRIAFNDENDERRRLIREKSGLPVVLYLSVTMIVAGIIAGYFNLIIFYTLIVAGLIQLLICFVLKMVNMKRM